jgi:hypothetical protein
MFSTPYYSLDYVKSIVKHCHQPKYYAHKIKRSNAFAALPLVAKFFAIAA